MHLTLWVRAYRLFFGVLILAAITYQFITDWDFPAFSTANFFSFFTIQSNIIAAVVLLLGATVYATRRPSFAWDMVRGAATLYLITTGIVYGMLLAGIAEALESTEPWVNTTLHRVILVVMVVDLLVVPLAHRIGFRQALVWTVYPLIFLVYSLFRGPIVDWYPYPFLDPDKAGGYPGVAVVCFGILVGFLVFAALISWASRHVRLNVRGETLIRPPYPRADERSTA